VPGRRIGRPGDGHFSRGSIARPLKRSTRESMADRASPRDRRDDLIVGRVHSSLFDLAAGGVCLARLVTQPAGELLPHRFSLTARARCLRGGLLSVALSLASRPVGVTHHHALRSPDFPPAGSLAGRCGGRCGPAGRRPSGPLQTPTSSILSGDRKGKVNPDYLQRLVVTRLIGSCGCETGAARMNAVTTNGL
jgi:hypothetical protein